MLVIGANHFSDMQKEIFISAIILLSFTHNVMNAPTMFDFYKQSFEESKCVMPKTELKNETNSIYNLPLNSCRAVAGPDDKKLQLYEFCLVVFEALYSIVDCSNSTSNNDVKINVLFPTENLCEELKQVNSSQSESSFPESLKDEQSCLKFCNSYSDLCKSLVWIYRVKKNIGSHDGINTRSVVLGVSENKSIPIKPTKGTTPNILPDIDKNANSKLVVDMKPTNNSILMNFDNSKTNPSDEDANKSLEGPELTTKRKSSDVPEAVSDASAKNENSAAHGMEQSGKDIPIEGTATERKNSILEEKTIKTSAKDPTIPDISFSEPEKAIETIKKTEDINSFENGDIEEDFDEQRYAASPLRETSDKDKTIASIIEEKITETRDNHQSQQPLEGDSSDVSYSKGLPGDYDQPEESHFFIYFLFVIAILIGCYVLFHNKQKIFALILEGRHERRRRPSGVSYKKLETKT